jgi:hypothetical protein
MNLKSSSRWIAGACTLAAGIALPVLGQSATVSGTAGKSSSSSSTVQSTASSQGKLSVVSSQSLDDDGQQQSFELRVDGDTITAKRNGKELPASQIKREGDRIIILDEDGNEIRDLHIFQPATSLQRSLLTTTDGAIAQALANDGSFAWSTGEEPTVIIGVQMGDPGPALEKHLKLTPGTCTMITGLYEGLPAKKAGLGEYDIVVQVEGASPADRETLRNAISQKKAGEVIRLRVIQEGQPKDVEVEIAAYDKVKMSELEVHGQAYPLYQQLIERMATPQPGEAPTINLQQLPRVFVAPRESMNVDPNVAGVPLMRGAIQRQDRTDLNEKLEKLDARMAELETLLQRLIEQKQNQR